MSPPQNNGEGSNIISLLEKGFGFAVWEQLIKRELIVRNKLTFPKFQREADVAFLLEMYVYAQRIVVNSAIYYTYNCFYLNSKFSVNSIHNHIELYQRFLNLIEGRATIQQKKSARIRFFVLWFCHVVPINYVASSLPFAAKIKGLRTLMSDKTIQAWAKSLQLTDSNLLMKASVKLFNSNMPLGMYAFTKLKLFVKRNVKGNFKKKIYSE